MFRVSEFGYILSNKIRAYRSFFHELGINNIMSLINRNSSLGLTKYTANVRGCNDENDHGNRVRNGSSKTPTAIFRENEHLAISFKMIQIEL